MKGCDGATRKSRDTAIVCRSNKNSVTRVLKHSDIKEACRGCAHARPGRSAAAGISGQHRQGYREVRDEGFGDGRRPASARRHARNGHSRRQMARVVEALEQGRLQRLITRSGSRLRPSYRRADAQSRSIFISCHTTAGGSARDS